MKMIRTRPTSPANAIKAEPLPKEVPCAQQGLRQVIGEQRAAKRREPSYPVEHPAAVQGQHDQADVFKAGRQIQQLPAMAGKLGEARDQASMASVRVAIPRRRSRICVMQRTKTDYKMANIDAKV